MSSHRPLSLLVGSRLALMMFLQFIVWGAWYVTAPRVLTPLGFDGDDIGWTYSVGPIAGMISPFFVGMIADRFFSTERVLGVMHLLGGAAMFGAIGLMKSDDPSPPMINFMLFVHMLCYFPTIALVNSLSMHTMTDPQKQFPFIRVFGTIGWIAAGFTLDFLDWGTSMSMFYLAGGTAFALGVYSFSLPHIPPPSKGQEFSFREAIGLDAFVLLKKPSFAIFMLSSFLICIPLAFYFQLAERALGAAQVPNTPRVMAYGQVLEILFMVLMPFCFKRLGVKWMLGVGMLAWVVRYGLFMVGTPDNVRWMLYTAVIIHGVCYDFFFVTGQIYTDQAAPKKIRSQAQGMLVLFTLGLGMAIGAQIGGAVEKHYTDPGAAAIDERVKEISAQIEPLAEDDPSLPQLKETLAAAQLERLRALDWPKIWRIPAAGALVVLIFFLVIFREKKSKDDDSEESENDEGSS